MVMLYKKVQFFISFIIRKKSNYFRERVENDSVEDGFIVYSNICEQSRIIHSNNAFELF